MGRWSNLNPPQDTTHPELHAAPSTESTAWSGAPPGDQTLVYRAGEQGDAAVLADPTVNAIKGRISLIRKRDNDKGNAGIAWVGDQEFKTQIV
jgi:hypothetical protein